MTQMSIPLAGEPTPDALKLATDLCDELDSPCPYCLNFARLMEEYSYPEEVARDVVFAWYLSQEESK